VLTVCGLLTKVNYPFFDSWILHLALFVSYATIYPNAAVFWTVPSKWMVALILGGFGLYCLAYHNWSLLLVAWISALVAYLATRTAGVGDELPLFSSLREKFQSRPAPRLVKTKLLTRGEPESEDVLGSVDAILEKISGQGMSSLTPGERATLERARVSLLKRKERDS
jgi:hypothetical protein